MTFSILLLLLILLPFAAAIAVFALGKMIKIFGRRGRCTALILVCLAELALTVYLALYGRGAEFAYSTANLYFNFSGFRLVYALVTTFMWTGAALLSMQYFKHHGISLRYCFFFLFTLGATLGVFLSSHLLTTFIFFELMSLASYAWVVEEETRDARKAGKTYLTIAVLGGMVTLMGLFLLHHLTGTLDVSALKAACTALQGNKTLYAAAFCILFGFGAKAGMFPVHIWLPKAHPVAPAPASALLSGVLTKTGVFGILVVTAEILPENHLWGNTLLLLGAVTMFLGAFLALFSINLKRTLACSSMSQIGFILVGVSMIALLGEENALAANGTVLYMMNHSLVKLVLFLSAGAIYSIAHSLDLNDLRGFGRKRPVLGLVFLLGACSLSGIPGTLGYLSKTLVHEAIVEYAVHGGAVITAVEWLFLLSGGLTAAYMTKLFVAIFLEKPNEQPSEEKEHRGRVSLLSYVALFMGLVPILLLGLKPHEIAEQISHFSLGFVGGHAIEHEVHYFAWHNLKGVCISLGIAVVVYFAVVRPLLMKKDGKTGRRVYINRWPSKLAIEDLGYVPLGKLLVLLLSLIARAAHKLPEPLVRKVFLPILRFLARIVGDLPDAAVLGARATVLHPVLPEPEKKQKHRFALWVGDKIDRYLRKNDPEAHTAETIIQINQTLRSMTDKIMSNFSFSLLMACLGIVVILVVLLVFMF